MGRYSEIKAINDHLINWDIFAQTHAAVGVHFVRLLGYFREDGPKLVTAIEQAFQQRESRDLVLPAHSLKGESSQFGAEQLSLVAEEIEMAARHFVETQQDPSELIEQVSKLRPLFQESLTALEDEISPLVKRSAHNPMPRMNNFGRRSA